MFKALLSLKSKFSPPKTLWLVLAVTVIAFGLRLYRLGVNDLWYDEVLSVVISRNLSIDWNPPLYFIILHYWIKLFGSSEFALRFLSLIFSVLSVPCLYILGEKIFNRRVGLYACGIMALSGFHIWYAQEARPYSLSILLSILSTYFFFRFLTEKKILLAFFCSLFTVLGFFSNITYYHLFLLFAQFLAAGIFIKKNFYSKLFILFSIIALIFALRAEKFISKFMLVRSGFWIPEPTLKSLITTIENFNLGYNSSACFYWLSNLSILTILVIGFLVLKLSKEEQNKLAFMVMIFFLPLAVIFAFSKIFFPVYLDRGMIIFSPYYYLLLCFGVDSLKNPLLKKIISGVLLISLFCGLFSYYRNAMFVGPECRPGVILKKPYQPALRFIEDNLEPGDVIMHTNSSTQEVFKFYAKKQVDQSFLFAAKMVDYCWNRPYVSSPGFISVEEVAALKAKRIWVVSCDWWRGKRMDDNSEAVNAELNRVYKRDLTRELDGIWIYRYIQP